MGISRLGLSGSTRGAPILITSTSSATANIIHTALSSTGSTSWDEIHLGAFNNSTGAINLTIEYGSPSVIIRQSVPSASGVVQVLPGSIGNGGLIIKAFKGGAGEVGVVGIINRFTP